jgi:hypothetical protein
MMQKSNSFMFVSFLLKKKIPATGTEHQKETHFKISQQSLFNSTFTNKTSLKDKY